MTQNKLYRRDFIRQTALGCTAIASVLPMLSCHGKQAALKIPMPTPAQVSWQDCELGILYSFDLAIAAGRFDVKNNAYKEIFDPQKYNPEKLDTGQWIEAAKAAGAKYAIFTATHFNGFMQWQSDIYPYGLKQAKWKNGKGDVVGDFVNSCNKAGIKPGLFMSTHRNAYWQLWGHYVDWGKGKGTPKQEGFNRVAERMFEELCSRYGELVQVWFDAGAKLPHEGGSDVLSIFDKYQPNSVFYNSSKRSGYRWIGNESGYANYPCWATMPVGDGHISHNAPSWKPILESGDPDGEIWSPGMVDVPMRGTNSVHNWFWAPGQDQCIYPKEKLVEMYYNSVGRNCNLIIGEVITPEGLVPETDIQRLKEFGDEIKKRFSSPLGKTSGEGNEFIMELPSKCKVNHIIIQEDIKYGERIRKYVVEGKVEGNWIKLCDGESIGHKRIQQFKDVVCTALRLKISKGIACPLVKNFSAYIV